MSTYEIILAQFQNAQIKHVQGDFSGALALYDAILQAKPDLEEVHANKGVVLRDLRLFEEALAAFDRALEINPNLVEAQSNKGFILTELDKPAEALACLDHAIAISPDLSRRTQ